MSAGWLIGYWLVTCPVYLLWTVFAITVINCLLFSLLENIIIMILHDVERANRNVDFLLDITNVTVCKS